MAQRVENARITDYTTLLLEPTRSPSKGGNGRAHHSHRITINGEHYSWHALGFRQWIYKSDTVTFEWEWDPSKRYRNIDPESIVVADKPGKEVVRGERGGKNWRSAQQRTPVSRREDRS